MRKTLLMLLLLQLGQQLWAQWPITHHWYDFGYCPMLEPGRSWHYERTKADGSTDRVALRLVADVASPDGSKGYKLAYCTPEDSVVRYVVSEEGGNVISYDMENDMRPAGLFTFDVMPGQDRCEWHLGGGMACRQELPGALRMRDYTDAHGIVRGRLAFYSNGVAAPADVWVAGIGSGRYGLLSEDRLADVANGDVLRLVSCTDADGNVLFSSEDFTASRLGSFAYRPTIEDKKVWYCASIRSDAPLSDLDECYLGWQFQYFTDGDTIVNGRECLKLYGHNHYLSGKTEYLCAVYEQDRRVWFIESGSTEERLLYDFTMAPGEKLTVSYGTMKGLGGTATKNGDSYLCLDDAYIHCHDFSEGAVCEGIGAETGFFMPMVAGNVGARYSLLLCTLNGEVVYDSHEFSRDLVLSVGSPLETNAKASGSVYDLQGRRVQPRTGTEGHGGTASLPRGVYIRDGRKVAVK